MAEVPAREHLQTLIDFYQAAEKLHRQAEADVVFAKKRRDEARALKADAWERLEDARKKYDDVPDLEYPPPSPLRESSRRLVKREVVRKSSVRNQEGSPFPQPQPDQQEGGDVSENLFSPTGHAPLSVQESMSDPINSLAPIPDLMEHDAPGGTRRDRNSNIAQDSEGGASTGAVLRGRRSKVPGIPDSTGEARDRVDALVTPHRNRKSNVVVPSSTTETPRTRVKNLVSPAGRRSTMVKAHSLHRRSISLDAKNMDFPVLGICKGRSREWYETNFDAESLGLAKRFYVAALGTKIHAATNQVYISSVLLNDEWNTMVTTTSEVQELYIGVSNTSDGKETLRDRAARALVQPPQKEPVAIFYAPKNTRQTDDIYYGGHWKVVAGNMLEPPRVVKGMPRQCLAKFVFCGINSSIVKAINGE